MEDAHQLLRWNDLELIVGTVCGWLVRTPAPEVGEVAKAVALHVLVGYLYDELDA